MHTYFQPALSQDGEESEQGQQATLAAWAQAWEAAGWETRVLNQSVAMEHSDYDELKRKFSLLPTVNPGEYEMSCYLRHVAMAAVGGGWMADYDVVPIHMPRCMDLPNDERFTTHEKFVPSMVSASADEYARVAHLISEVPWDSNANVFSYEGRPHVSDMLALQFIGSIGQTMSSARGCGVVNADKIFMSGECSICKHGGSPLAIHFSHSVMDKLKYYTPRVPRLNCSTTRSEYPDWNHWRAACLIEASKELNKYCEAEARSPENKTVLHEGQSCHAQCDGEPGACPEFCGSGGACCRRGFVDAMEEPDCDFGDVGCEDGHCCVPL